MATDQGETERNGQDETRGNLASEMKGRPPDEAAALLAEQPVSVIAGVLSSLNAGLAQDILAELPGGLVEPVLEELPPIGTAVMTSGTAASSRAKPAGAISAPPKR